jgi:hypothetical protein
MPFFLAFGVEAMMPLGLEYGSTRIEAYEDERETTDAQLVTDLLDEARDKVVVCSAKYQLDLRLYHDRQVCGRSFNVEDLVL